MQTSKKITLKEFLSEININVHDYTTKCKELTSNNLYLEIQAVNTDNKTITYQVPIKLNDSCKK